MKKLIFIFILLVSTFNLFAATLTDSFDNGISSQLWTTFYDNASGAPWTVDTLNSEGKLIISKPSDTVGITSCVAGIKSNFFMDGDFTVSVDFDCINFPISANAGWNEAILSVGNIHAGFESLKEAKGMLSEGGYFTEGFTNLVGGGLTTVPDSALSGTLGLTRNGNTIFNWIDRKDGSGRVTISTWSSNLYLGEMSISLWLNQQIILDDRPHTALDVRFDNFALTADTITPEPCSFMLLGLGVLLLKTKTLIHIDNTFGEERK